MAWKHVVAIIFSIHLKCKCALNRFYKDFSLSPYSTQPTNMFHFWLLISILYCAKAHSVLPFEIWFGTYVKDMLTSVILWIYRKGYFHNRKIWPIIEVQWVDYNRKIYNDINKVIKMYFNNEPYTYFNEPITQKFSNSMNSEVQENMAQNICIRFCNIAVCHGDSGCVQNVLHEWNILKYVFAWLWDWNSFSVIHE